MRKLSICLATTLLLTCPAQAIDLSYVATETDQQLAIVQPPDPPVVMTIHGYKEEPKTTKQRLKEIAAATVKYALLYLLLRRGNGKAFI